MLKFAKRRRLCPEFVVLRSSADGVVKYLLTNNDVGESEWGVLTTRGDVAFAGDSDTSYNAQVFLSRRFGETMAPNLGYRYLKDDYSDPGVYGWDMVQQSPVVGYTWVF